MNEASKNSLSGKLSQGWLGSSNELSALEVSDALSIKRTSMACHDFNGDS